MEAFSSVNNKKNDNILRFEIILKSFNSNNSDYTCTCNKKSAFLIEELGV